MGTKRCNNIRASDAAIRSQDRRRAGPRLPGCRKASQQPSLSLYSQWNMHNTTELGVCVSGEVPRDKNTERYGLTKNMVRVSKSVVNP